MTCTESYLRVFYWPSRHILEKKCPLGWRKPPKGWRDGWGHYQSSGSTAQNMTYVSYISTSSGHWNTQWMLQMKTTTVTISPLIRSGWLRGGCSNELADTFVVFSRYLQLFRPRHKLRPLPEDLWTRPQPGDDDVIKWKHFPRYWPFAPGIHRSPVISPHKGPRRGALMFSLICAWINAWVNKREAGDLRRLRVKLWRHCNGWSPSSHTKPSPHSRSSIRKECHRTTHSLPHWRGVIPLKKMEADWVWG